MRNVIVTGATGFIGKNLIMNLLCNNIHVFALVRNSSLLKSFSSSYLTVFECNLDNLLDFNEIRSDKIDVFYHLAWEGSNGPDRSNYKLQLKNIETTIKCMEFAEHLGCKKFVSTGTISENLVDQLPLVVDISENIIYGLSKFTSFIMLHLLMKKRNTILVWAQLSNVYGKNDDTGNIINYTISKLKDNLLAEFSSGESYYDFVYIDDVINALRLLGERNTTKGRYFIGSGQPRLLKEFLIDIGRTMDKLNLIGLGLRPNDELIYEKSWFSIKDLVRDTGYSSTNTFHENIKSIVLND